VVERILFKELFDLLMAIFTGDVDWLTPLEVVIENNMRICAMFDKFLDDFYMAVL
jgi:hypothetical protein